MIAIARKAAYLGNGASLVLDESTCIGCGDCVDVCPHVVFAIVARGAAGTKSVARIVARGSCIECGACALNCPVGALAVTRGVGCAAAIINGKLRGTAPNCDCGDSGCC